MANLQAFKENGQILFDTNLICYGLVKSGNMSYIHSWTRKEFIRQGEDPNYGVNWSATTAIATPHFADQIHGFTVVNPISPIAFITGSGCLVGTQVAGNTMTFYYTNASPSTKFYCFDLMADNMSGTTFLKTYDSSGRITFNSLQPPLNVVGAVQAPGVGTLDGFGRYYTCYAGGSNRQRQANGNVGGIVYVAQADSYVNVPIGAAEYAAYLPWSRSCQINDLYPAAGGFSQFAVYSGSEGAYGYNGGITFMFGATGGTTTTRPNTSGYGSPVSFSNIPTDRYPVALVIKSDNYPFPFN